jgi:hypothetical protein
MRTTLLVLAACLIMYACDNNAAESKPTETGVTETKATPQSEFADAKYAEWGKQQMAHFVKGDYDAWGEQLADNIVYRWSSGDSIAGKAAVINYWKERRKNYIDSVSISNDIWLPVKVNTPQRGPDMPGVWNLQWHQVDVKYKNGKKLTIWTHQAAHYNDADKIDRITIYQDRAPIKEALGQ